MKGYTVLLASSFLFAFTCVFARILDQWFLPLQQVLYRDAVFLILTLIAGWPKRDEFKLWRNESKTLLIFGGAYSFTFLCFTLSVLHTSFLAAISSMYASSILVSVFIGKFKFKENFRIQSIVSIILALSGIFLFAAESKSIGLNAGIVYGTLAGVFLTVSNSLRKDMSKKTKTVVIIRIQSIVSVIIYTVLVLVSGSFTVTNWEPVALLWLMGYALVNFLISIMLVFGFKNTDLNKGSMALSSELVFAAALGFIVYSEIPKLFQWIGSLLIICAIIVSAAPLPVNLRADYRRFFPKGKVREP